MHPKVGHVEYIQDTMVITLNPKTMEKLCFFTNGSPRAFDMIFDTACKKLERGKIADAIEEIWKIQYYLAKSENSEVKQNWLHTVGRYSRIALEMFLSLPVYNHDSCAITMPMADQMEKVAITALKGTPMMDDVEKVAIASLKGNTSGKCANDLADEIYHMMSS
jgi:hypothetical protein